MTEIENFKLIYPNIEYVATVWIIQSENDGTFDVRVWDECKNRSDEYFETNCFESWDKAQEYIENLYEEHPEVYFNRKIDMDELL